MCMYQTLPFAALPRVTDVKDVTFINEQLLLPFGHPPITELAKFLATYREGKQLLK